MRPQSETTFGCRLAAIRKDRGLSQAELATVVAKTRAAIGHWESGRAFIRGSDLARVARALEAAAGPQRGAAIGWPVPLAT